MHTAYPPCVRLFNEFTAGSDLLRIWPRTTTPNSIAAFSMIHLLYDRVDRDSALITRPSHPARGQLSVADSDARRREKGGIKTERRGREDSRWNFSRRGSSSSYRFSFIFIGGRWGGDRVLWGSFRFRPPLPPSPLDSEGLVGHFG